MAPDMVLTCQIVTECLPVRLPWMYYILFAYVREKQYFAFYNGMTGWISNDYDINQWTKMEIAGAVFLPASGGRDGLHTGNMQNIGGCWSSTHDNDYMWAYGLSFGSSYFPAGGCGWIARSSGVSVRLVRDL